MIGATCAHTPQSCRGGAQRSALNMDVRECLVLVVDDVADNRELFQESLVGRGYPVVAAADGAAAVTAVTLHRPAIVIMDLGMPNVDGYEATRQIRAMREIVQPYIFAVSAFIDRTSRNRALEAGCDEFLSKPLFPQDLADRLDRVCEQSSSGKARAL
jgi:two-component system, sensor histidine kinase